MINAIIESISMSLYEEFGENYEIYMEEIKQDLKEPCFFISCINPTSQLFLGKRYFRQNQFVIQYFPESDEIQRECNDIAEHMNWCLEHINVNGSLLRGTQMKHQVIDGVLNFFVNYNCFVYKAEEKTAMDALETNVSAKEGD